MMNAKDRQQRFWPRHEEYTLITTIPIEFQSKPSTIQSPQLVNQFQSASLWRINLKPRNGSQLEAHILIVRYLWNRLDKSTNTFPDWKAVWHSFWMDELCLDFNSLDFYVLRPSTLFHLLQFLISDWVSGVEEVGVKAVFPPPCTPAQVVEPGSNLEESPSETETCTSLLPQVNCEKTKLKSVSNPLKKPVNEAYKYWTCPTRVSQMIVKLEMC